MLGELSEQEQLALERDYFTDDAAYERLLVAEDELSFDYVQGRLSPKRRAHFESTIGATDRGRQNVEFARSLLAALETAHPRSGSWAPAWAAGIAAVLVLGVASAWLAYHVADLQGQVQRLRAAEKIPPAAPPPATEVAFLLTPGLSRSQGGVPRLQLSPEDGAVRFQLVAPPGAATGDHVITMRVASGAELWSQSAPLASSLWTVTIPAKILPSGPCEIAVRRLTSGEQAADLAKYSFRVVR